MSLFLFLYQPGSYNFSYKNISPIFNQIIKSKQITQGRCVHFFSFKIAATPIPTTGEYSKKYFLTMKL